MHLNLNIALLHLRRRQAEIARGGGKPFDLARGDEMESRFFVHLEKEQLRRPKAFNAGEGDPDYHAAIDN